MRSHGHLIGRQDAAAGGRGGGRLESSASPTHGSRDIKDIHVAGSHSGHAAGHGGAKSQRVVRLRRVVLAGTQTVDGL